MKKRDFINLHPDNIDWIINKFFPSGSGFDCSYEVDETKNADAKSFHIKSSYHCMDEHGGYDGYQDFTVIINKKWYRAGFKLEFNNDRYKSQKYQLRDYMEDTLHHHFMKLFETDEELHKIETTGSHNPAEFYEVPSILTALEMFGKGMADYLAKPIDKEDECVVKAKYKGRSYIATFPNLAKAEESMIELKKIGAEYAFKPTRVEPKKYFMKYRYTEIGYCQVHFYIKTAKGNKGYYCLMEEGAKALLYQCSEDGEADHAVKLKENVVLEFEKPEDGYGQMLLNSYLTGDDITEWKITRGEDDE